MKKNSIIISDDAQTVNFREISMGNIAPNILYRSSHPIKGNKEEKVISMLASQAGIQTIVNLCDTDSEIKIKSIFAPWYGNLLEKGRIIALGMDYSFTSVNFKKKLKNALQFITASEGPCLIHCYAGVDRTGFISMVLESLMGAALDDIIDDYLLSFSSIFESSIFEEPQKPDANVVMKLLSAMNDSAAISGQNLQSIAENYLRNKIKLSAKEIDLLKKNFRE